MPLDLNRFFLEEGTDLNFFQAVYLMEKIFQKQSRVGTGDDMRTEAIRFETLNTLSFPPSEVAFILPPLSFRKQAEQLEESRNKELAAFDLATLPPFTELPKQGQGPLRMALTFMGLYGVSSPLPSYFVDPITLRKIEYFELKKFLDIFTHRMYSMFYRSWKKYRHFAQFQPNIPDDYTLRLLALTGQWPRRRGKAQPESEAPKFDLRRIPYARYLGNRVRSAKGLQQLLRGYFGFSQVRIKQFEVAWVEIPVKTKLGEPGAGLGVSTRIGDRMQDRVSRFTVEIGPLPRELFNRFLPSPQGSPLLDQVKELIDAYLRDPLDYQVKVILEPDADEAPTLGSVHARMGMGIWLGSRPSAEVACRL